MVFRRVVTLHVYIALSLGVLPALAVPAAAQGILPVDPPILLPSQPGGHDPAQVALREDGGFVAVWVDVTRQASIGRWFGKDAVLDEEGKGGAFELMGDGTVERLCGLARSVGGKGDRFLAAWEETPGVDRPNSVPPGLLVRPFDGEGRPLGPVVQVLDSSAFDCALAPRPDGGWVIAWWSPTSDSLALMFQSLDSQGRPEGPRRVAIDALFQRPAPGAGLAVASTGHVLVTWGIATRRVEDEIILFGRVYPPPGHGLESAEIVLVGPVAGPVVFDLVAVAGPGFLIAWNGLDSESGVQVRAFDVSGTPTGPARRLDLSVEGRAPEGLALASGLDRDAVVAWIEGLDAGGPVDDRVVARLVDGDGAPRSGPFEVLSDSAAAVALDGQTGGLTRVDVARDGAGRLVFGWGLYRNSPVIPTAVDSNWTSGGRRFRETLEGCSPVLTADVRTDPTPPVEGEPLELVIEGLAACAEVVLTGVTESSGTIRVEAAAESQACGTFPPFPYELVAPVGPFDDGPRTVELEIALPAGGVCARSFAFEVVPREEAPPPDDPLPPSRPALTSPELPGFRVWAEITPQGQATVPGTRVADCLPEVLCVAGALPDRAEVFVRVIGPRPNGFLWPVLVQLTPSGVEVWIEQIATGEINYYRLEAAEPGLDELDGLFDRTGFVPQ